MLYVFKLFFYYYEDFSIDFVDDDDDNGSFLRSPVICLIRYKS